jgi:predicted DNA-binding protein
MTAPLSIRLPPALRAALQAAADKDGRTLSDYIRRVLDRAVSG